MAATEKINSLTLVSYSLLQTLFRYLGRTVLPQYKTSQTDDRQTTQCTKGSTDSMVSQKPFLSRTTRVSQYQKGKTRKVKPIWIY